MRSQVNPDMSLLRREISRILWVRKIQQGSLKTRLDLDPEADHTMTLTINLTLILALTMTYFKSSIDKDLDIDIDGFHTFKNIVKIVKKAPDNCHCFFLTTAWVWIWTFNMGFDLNSIIDLRH